jgi:hypothetical protein
MKGVKIQLVITAVFFCTLTAGAETMGTEFIYQGRLMDANQPADGPYDFQFKLYDDPNVIEGKQVGSSVEVNELDIIDGYFTVELDFGTGVFDGYARWLQIAVRPGASVEPNDYVTLNPLQELTPTPYAQYAESTGPDNDWMVSGDDMYSIPDGNVGIGTETPSAKLDVEVSSGGAATIGSGLNSATGGYAIAMGAYTDATGDCSTAMGYGTIASGNFSTAMGKDTTASSLYSTAMGFGTTSGECATAMGRDTTASGYASTAMGRATTASGNFSTAMGRFIEAAGYCSVAIALNDQFGVAVTQNNTMSIMGGSVGIDTTTPYRRFFVNGDAGGTTAWYNDSDSRLKKNIVSIDNALEKVNKLRGVEFEWKDPYNHVEGRQIGFIGQETVKAVPEVVDVKDGRYSMQYAPLTALLVEAVKELKAENELLKKRLEAQEKTLQQFRAVITK